MVSVSNPIEPAKEVQPTEEKWQVEEVASTVTIEKEVTTNVPQEIKQPVPQETEVVQATVSKKQSLPETAWTIQLGAFQSASNINALLKTLHKAGFQAHTVPKEVIDGELTRVFVGPDVSKSKLEKQLARLKQLTQLEGKLYPFDAVNP
ncbi:SPOR domain-containing protein [Psychromonas sp. KJ10-10]|uniref:SPOR domain-containing protein n=1 Tax=Psychromonas sp. KJ10-10 TaxID=3391823 RepID=UPI0039B58BB1